MGWHEERSTTNANSITTKGNRPADPVNTNHSAFSIQTSPQGRLIINQTISHLASESAGFASISGLCVCSIGSQDGLFDCLRLLIEQTLAPFAQPKFCKHFFHSHSFHQQPARTTHFSSHLPSLTNLQEGGLADSLTSLTLEGISVLARFARSNTRSQIYKQCFPTNLFSVVCLACSLPFSVRQTTHAECATATPHHRAQLPNTSSGPFLRYPHSPPPQQYHARQTLGVVNNGVGLRLTDRREPFFLSPSPNPPTQTI